MSMWKEFKNGIAKIMNINTLPTAEMNDESFLEWLGIKKDDNKTRLRM